MPASQDLSALEPLQRRALELLVEGATIAGAARTLGIHRTTVHHWKRTQPAFRDACQKMLELRDDAFQENAIDLSLLATEALAHLLTSPETPPAQRLRAIQIALGPWNRRPLGAIHHDSSLPEGE
jgi:transposase-like protein